MMTSPTCRISVPDRLEVAFAVIADSLKAAGLSIANPSNGRITTWTDEGEQLAIDPAGLLSKVTSNEIANVQFWKMESDDVFVSWKREGVVCTFLIYLDGVDVSCSVAMASKLMEALLTTYKNSHLEGDVFAINFE